MLSPGVLGRVAGRGSFFLRPLCVGGGVQINGGELRMWPEAEDINNACRH